MIPDFVYSLCALTCWACAVLLLRGFHHRRSRLLLWSGLAFCAFGIGNILLCVDLLVLPQIDLTVARNLVTLLGIGLLLRGLVGEGWK